MLSEAISDGLNFTLIIMLIVLLGTVVLESLRDKDKRKNLGTKISLFFLVLFSLIFFNFVFMIEVFEGIDSLIWYLVMAVFAVSDFFITIYLFSRHGHNIDKKSLVAIMVSILVGIPFYVITNFLSFPSLALKNLIESGFMLIFLICLYNLVMEFFIKNRETKKR